jgi:hypothetical protein
MELLMTQVTIADANSSTKLRVIDSRMILQLSLYCGSTSILRERSIFGGIYECTVPAVKDHFSYHGRENVLDKFG